jgi:hypothetical protein
MLLNIFRMYLKLNSVRKICFWNMTKKPGILLLQVTHWTCSPLLFHKFGYTRRCGNWRVRIFTTKLTDTFSVRFFSRKRFDNKHMLFSSELHFSRPPINDCDILYCSDTIGRDSICYLKLCQPFARNVVSDWRGLCWLMKRFGMLRQDYKLVLENRQDA